MKENETKIIIPILPGKVEAWRRFLQELEGSQADEFSVWCENIGVEIKQIILHDSLGGSLVSFTIFSNDPTLVSSKLSGHSSPFSHWFIDQVHTLHGLDLYRMQVQ